MTRVFLSALVPVAVLYAVGQLDLMPYALLTSVISVYGRRLPRGPRLLVQGQALTLQAVVLMLGALVASLSPGPYLIVVAAALIAGVCTVVADAGRWAPPGALFFVFGFAVTASNPVPEAGILLAAITVVSTAVFVLVVTRSLSAATVVGGAVSAGVERRRAVTLVHAAACVVGAAAAGLIAVRLGLTHPYWAIVSAIIPVVGHTTSGQMLRATHRVMGTIVGLLVAFGLFVIPLPTPVLLLLLVVLMALTEIVIARNYAIALLFLTPFTVGLTVLAGNEDLPTVLNARGLETVLGAAIGAALVVATHRVRHPIPPASPDARRA